MINLTKEKHVPVGDVEIDKGKEQIDGTVK